MYWLGTFVLSIDSKNAQRCNSITILYVVNGYIDTVINIKGICYRQSGVSFHMKSATQVTTVYNADGYFEYDTTLYRLYYRTRMHISRNSSRTRLAVARLYTSGTCIKYWNEDGKEYAEKTILICGPGAEHDKPRLNLTF